MIGPEETGIRRRPFMVAAIAVTASAILAICLAASRSVAAGPEAAPSPQATGYLPSISDLMIATIQPRHERLWRAEQDGNWEFADYELGNLKGQFDDLLRKPISEGGYGKSDEEVAARRLARFLDFRAAAEVLKALDSRRS